jgi:PAS domain S-box-containing protein
VYIRRVEPLITSVEEDTRSSFLDGGGETGRLIASQDWSTTPLGARRDWPASLKTMLGFLLRSPVPIVMLWGKDGIMLYNDAYSVFAAGRHPRLLGSKVREGWPEVADFNDNVMRVGLAGGTLAYRDQELTLYRHGRPEQVFMNLDYGPVPGEDGKPAGVLAIVVETTERVLAERRREALIDLDTRLRDCVDTAEHSFAASEVLGKLLGAMRAGYGVLDSRARRILVERNWGAPNVADVAGVHDFAEYGSYIEELLAGSAVANEDVRLDPRTAGHLAAFEAFGIRAHIDVPVIEDGRAVAGIFVHSDTPRVWTREEIALVQEFAERTHAAIARRAAERELRFALKAGRLGAWTFDITTGELTTSEICRRNFGRPIEAPFTYAELSDAVHLDDKERVTEAVRRSVATGEDYDIECRVRTPAGETRWVQIRGQTGFAEDGSALRMTGVSLDVTERREAERKHVDTAERLHLATENAEVGFWDVDPIADTLVWPARTKAMFGISPEAPVTMQDFYDGLHPDDRRATSEAYAAAADPARRALYDVEYRTIGKEDGKVRWVAAKGRGVFDRAGRCIRVVGTAVDVTARKRAEGLLRELNDTLETRVAERTRELETAHEQLRQSQKLEAMGSLTGGVAHDFNNLLSPIVGTLDLLKRRGVGGEREQRLIAAATQSADRAKTLVQRLLAFARRQPLQSVAVDLGRLVENMADLVSSTTGPQIRVVVEIAKDLPAAKADPNQLEMALLNLSLNARDAMPEGGTLRISAVAESLTPGEKAGLKAGRYLCLSVADTGAGMDEITIARAVEPFFSTKGIGKGTGLGLSMVHGLAAQLGGSLVIKSKPGFGTNVELWLPATDAVPNVVDIVPEAELARGRGTALLVDDEDLVRLSTAEMLVDLGYAVVEAATAEEALRVIRADARIDLVITDHLMPGLSGTELAYAMRDRRADLPVLVISGYAEVEGMAVDLPRLTKPFTRDELAASLNELSPPVI